MRRSWVVAKWPKGAYLLAGETWIALTLDPQVRTQTLPEYTHVAFTVSSSDFESMRRRITDSGAPIWQDNQTEGASLYFADPNGHKLEIHASDLRSRLQAARRDRGRVWSCFPWKHHRSHRELLGSERSMRSRNSPTGR